MFSYQHILNGDLRKAVESQDLNFGVRLFSLLALGNRNDIYRALKKIIKSNGISEAWANRSLLLAACIALCDRNFILFNENLSKVEKFKIKTGDAFDGFFINTYYFMSLIDFRSRNFENLKNLVINDVALIGDSHILVLSQFETSSESFYIPGIELKHLADPLNNIWKQGIINALHLSRSKQKIVLSITEIESRLLTSKIAKKSNYWIEKKDRYKDSIDKAFAFIASYVHPLSNNIILLPPKISPHVYREHIASAINSGCNKDFFSSEIIHANQQFRELIYTTLKKYNFIAIDYSQEVVGDFVPEAILLDHAHFKPQVYSDILSIINAL